MEEEDTGAEESEGLTSGLIAASSAMGIGQRDLHEQNNASNSQKTKIPSDTILNLEGK